MTSRPGRGSVAPVASTPKLWPKRGVWYARIGHAGGPRRQVSLRTRDRDEAIARARELELLGDATWLPQRSRERTVETAADAFLQVVVHGCSPATVRMHRQKARNIARHLGDRSIARYDRTWTLSFIELRLGEGVSRHTLSKELSTLRGILSEAMARGWLASKPMQLLVPRFRAEYIPRERAPTPEQAARLLAQLPEMRRPWILLALSGLRSAEIERLRWLDISETSIRVPGTKTRRSVRTIPRPTFLSALLPDPSRPEDLVVPPWTNVRRDLHAACHRADIPRFSPNDLRRAVATWLRAAGTRVDVIAKFLGHAPGSAVTSRVYAHAPDAELVQAVAQLPNLGVEPPPDRPKRGENEPTAPRAPPALFIVR